MRNREKLSEKLVRAAETRHRPWQVFDTEVPRNIRLGEAPSFGKPIHAYDPLCRGAVAYSRLATEVIRRARGEDVEDEDTASTRAPLRVYVGGAR